MTDVFSFVGPANPSFKWCSLILSEGIVHFLEPTEDRLQEWTDEITADNYATEERAETEMSRSFIHASC